MGAQDWFLYYNLSEKLILVERLDAFVRKLTSSGKERVKAMK